MKQWLNEITEQIGLGELLAATKLDCGERFGLIAIDNAVEYMLISYIEMEKRLVGGHISGGFKKPDWVKIKEHFPQILSSVVKVEPRIAVHERDINNFHDFRSRLYHTGAPLSIRPKYVYEYAELARTLFSLLFGKSYTQKEWGTIVNQVRSSLCLEKSTGGFKQEVKVETINQQIRLVMSPTPNQPHAVALVLHGYKTRIGETPSRQIVLKCLSLSGCGMKSDVLNTRIHELRQKKWIDKDTLVLTARGRTELLKPYIIS